MNAADVSWVVTIFFIVFGIGTVVFGKLSDLYDVRTLITIGIVLYATGSIVGFACRASYPAVILARAIQGAGDSAIPALVSVIVARFFSADERGKLFGLLTSTMSFAVGIGPVIGGYVSHQYNWSFLFLIPVPVVSAIPVFLKHLAKEGRRPGRLDLIGTLLLSAFVSLLILFKTGAQWGYLLASLLSLGLFIAWIRRAKEPFVEPSLLPIRCTATES